MLSENSFLPSGAVSSTITASRYSSPLHPSTVFQSLPPLSPPKSRSASADERIATLIEDWRAYAQQLRSQFHGERAHLRADRNRMNEVIDGERELWERERELWNAELSTLKMRISDLETQLTQAKIVTPNTCQPPVPLKPTCQSLRSTSLDSSTSTNIPQESGRTADGIPFYAPAPKPTRSFNPEIASDLRVNDLTAPRETPIIVTSKALTSSDFVRQTSSPPTATVLPETIPEAIDICHIQPELDSVAIRVSAVLPSFAAKVLSPQRTPPKASPEIKPAKALHDLKSKLRGHFSNTKSMNSNVAAYMENKRTTMFAGHTPNYSLTKFDLSDSGASTPMQAQRNLDNMEKPATNDLRCNNLEMQAYFRACHTKMEDSCDQSDDGDIELMGALGLTNESGTDTLFLARLTEKLAEEARKGEADAEPIDMPIHDDVSETIETNSSCAWEADDVDECPVLRIKPSLNFGTRFGTV
ncbi:hypothetical protein K3495_g10410 [Podosphaera aphanis]|nr:hypothetical protein K3495_g10410 [Podosphaera aphanis]